MDRARRAAHGLLRSRVVRVLAVVLALAVAALSVEHLPPLAVGPLLLGLLPWCLGTYLLCPLRWHLISSSGRSRSWHMRVYAESELLGLLTPAHSGADLWRARQLRTTGQETRKAYAEVGVDRLVAGAGLLLFVGLSGGGLPPEVALPVLAAVATLCAVGLMLRLRRGGAAQRRLPPTRALLTGVALALGYQLAMFGLVLGGVQATGQHVGVLTLIGAFGASQAASLVPGVHGCSAREGALVAGLVAAGCTLAGAVGVVAAVTVAAWAPALALGGGSLLHRRLRGQWQPAPVAVLVPAVPQPRPSSDVYAPTAALAA